MTPRTLDHCRPVGVVRRSGGNDAPFLDGFGQLAPCIAATIRSTVRRLSLPLQLSQCAGRGAPHPGHHAYSSQILVEDALVARLVPLVLRLTHLDLGLLRDLVFGHEDG